MSCEGFTPQYRIIGKTAAWAVSFLLVVYTITTILGLLSLASPADPIVDPYFTIMELLIILIAPLMVISMVAVNAYASLSVRPYGQIALIFMILLACITSVVHFVVLTVSHPIEAAGLTGAPLFFSFTWPSVVYAMDILAWDWFFALSMLFAAPVFTGAGIEKAVRITMLASAVLSFAGLVGVALADMQIRTIGVAGYALVAIVVFLLLGMTFKNARCGIGDTGSP